MARREVEEERSIKNAPDIGLTLSAQGHLMLSNRCEDRDAHNISLREVETSSGYVLSTQSVPFLKRGSIVSYPVSAQRGQ